MALTYSCGVIKYQSMRDEKIFLFMLKISVTRQHIIKSFSIPKKKKLFGTALFKPNTPKLLRGVV